MLKYGLWIGLLVGGLAQGAAPGAEADAAAGRFVKAGELLAQGETAKAALEYEKLLAQQGNSLALHYNLGHAYFRNGATGRALFHFYQAARIAPRDGDARYNLNFVRKKTADKIEDKRSALVKYAEDFALVNDRETLYFLGGSIGFLTLVSVLLLFWKNDGLRWTQIVAAATVVLALIFGGARYFSHRDYGVITAGTADVVSSWGQNSVLLFTLHEGAEFFVEDQHEGWLKIVLKDGKKGWLAAQHAIYLVADEMKN
jgi:tetratricopeptide (TPR) repeat protein